MSSNLTTLQPGAGKVLPAAFAGAKAAPAFQGQKFEHASDGIEGSFSLIKYAGKVWSFSHRGETKPFLRPDDGTPRGSIDVIMVRASETKAKTYYEGFKEGVKEKPICWSNDAVHPDRSVVNPPSNACGICPKNVFGSRITDDGGKAKQCGDHKRVAVILDPALAMSVLGVPLSEPVMLRIPAASLNDFAIFGDTMEQQGFPLPSFITRISFDHTKNYPKFKFEAVRPLTDEEGVIAMALRNDPASSRITGGGGVVMESDDNTTPGTGQQQQIYGGPVNAGVATSANATSGAAQTGQPNPTNGQTMAPTQAPTPTPTNVVPMGVAPRLTPAQQAQAMASAAEPGAEPVTAFGENIDDQINALLS